MNSNISTRLRGLAVASGLLLVSGCGGDGSLSIQDGGVDATGDGPGVDATGDGPGVDAPLGCNLTKDPKDSAACIDDTVGIFVDAKASDTNPGTKAKPVATVNHALDLAAKQSLPRVYVCEGTYPAVSVDGTRDGKSAYGAFDCATWQVASKTVTVQSPDNKPALTMSAAGTFVDIAFVSKDAVTPSDSSIAVLANGATLTLRRAKVTAGVGASGMKPTDIADFGARAPDGDPGKINNGGSKVDNVCGNGTGTSSGAGGGGPTTNGNNGSNGDPFGVYPVNPANASGAKGLTGSDCFAGLGRDGSYGPGGTSGAGAILPGILSASGWTPAKGGDAAAGKVGQGGGGGASRDNTGGGGGGGTGGCGGVAGAGGTGGGASLAIVSFNSTVTLESTTLVTSKAGNGGQGGTGQKAQQGGNVGSFFIASCNGGSGGHGGSGGGGGGGAGGLSVGIAYSGTAPKIDGASVSDAPTLPSATLGMPGAAGAAGAGGPAFKTANPASNPGADGTPGVAGIAAAVKAI